MRSFALRLSVVPAVLAVACMATTTILKMDSALNFKRTAMYAILHNDEEIGSANLVGWRSFVRLLHNNRQRLDFLHVGMVCFGLVLKRCRFGVASRLVPQRSIPPSSLHYYSQYYLADRCYCCCWPVISRACHIRNP